MFSIFMCFLDFPPGISGLLYPLLRSFKEMNMDLRLLVLMLVSHLALICDRLSPSAQFMGSPKRLIRIEPEPTFPKFSAFENIHAYNTHTHVYCCGKTGAGSPWATFWSRDET